MTNKKFIKNLDDFFNSISEAFDNPLQIRWVDKDDILRGFFTVNDNIYQIVCENKGNSIWKYDFYFFEKDKNQFSIELTKNNKDKFRVLPTIKTGMQYLYDNKKVDAIVFGASDKSKGRKKIYESFCEFFSTNNNLKYYTKVHTDLETNIDRQIFILYKELINKELLTKTIFKILEEEKFGN